jgi:hypothetical protein
MTLEARYYKTKAAREEARKALLGPGLRIKITAADDRHLGMQLESQLGK